MPDDTPNDAPRDASDPEALERLAEMAERQERVVWGAGRDPEDAAAQGPGGVKVPGIFSGDVGPKADIATRLRRQSAAERRAGVDVPRGTAVPGTGRYVLGLVGGIVLVAVILLALLYWAVS